MKRFVIFYSWQSDIKPNGLGRSFVEDALLRATRELAKEMTLDIVVDDATRDVPGAPDIPATIFEKISQADMVVADLTIVTGGGEQRCSPNPNVLVEFGYALHALGENAVLAVINTNFGAIEDLPFDVSRRRVEAFALAEDADGKAELRTSLVKRLKRRIEECVSHAQRRPALVFGIGHPDGDAIGEHAVLTSKIADDLTDLPRSRRTGGDPLYGSMYNENYDAELVTFVRAKLLTTGLVFAARNEGESVLLDVRAELRVPRSEDVVLYDDESIPKEPDKSAVPLSLRVPVFNTDVVLDERAGEWRITVDIGKLQPGQTVITSNVLHVGATRDRDVQITGRVFADQLREPLDVAMVLGVKTEHIRIED